MRICYLMQSYSSDATACEPCCAIQVQAKIDSPQFNWIEETILHRLPKVEVIELMQFNK